MTNNTKRNPTLQFIKICCFILVVACIVTLSLIYHGRITSEHKTVDDVGLIITSKTEVAKDNVIQDKHHTLNFKKPVDHYVSGLDNSTRTFTYVIFSDPQLGMYDMMRGNDGTGWEYDINNIQKFSVAVNALKIKPDFIFCTGDLNNAYPTKEGFIQPGFQPRYHSQQTKDLKKALQKYLNNGIPFFTIAGNHDLSENTKWEHVGLYEQTWGQPYYYFWNGGRVFIALETQFFRSKEAETVELRKKEIQWLEKIFKSLPKTSPKTVFQHVPLFVIDSKEVDPENTLSKTDRDLLLRMFCENNVNIVFSGHTHFASLPKPYKCESNDGGRVVKQIVLTSITAQLRKNGKPSYTIAKVNSIGSTNVQVYELK